MRLAKFNSFCLLLVVLALFSLGATNPTTRTYPAPRLDEISASADALSPRPYSLLITVSGTITIGNRDGTSATVAVIAGQEIHCQPYKITNITDATVIGMYVEE